VLVPAFLASYLGSGDEIQVPLGPDQAGTEIHVLKNDASGHMRELYQTPIGCVTRPREDKRKDLFVVAKVPGSRLGVTAVQLPCPVLRDYFYVGDRQRQWCKQPTLYEVVRIPPNVTPGEMHLSFKIRQLELQNEGAPRGTHAALERAYNVLAQPELKACYDVLLQDPEAPALFPYGGFGSLLVSGDRSRDGRTFFATRILAYRPEMRQRRFRAPLRRFEFYPASAVYRDARRKLEVTVDQCVMPVVWDQAWNQWKHRLAAKVEVNATFVRAGKYRMKSGEWHQVEWESALPSRLEIKLPNNLQEQVESARRTYHYLGQYSQALDRIRARIERQPMEKKQLDRLMGELGVPGDIDVAELTWRPDYDPFYYQQLAKRARRLYLFREEYIFDAGQVAVETPQLGHATYLFAKPASMESFLALYIRTSKQEIRVNRNNVAERLGFLCRMVHGSNARAWLKELGVKLGEPLDHNAAAATVD
jgi:hypothetical protein